MVKIILRFLLKAYQKIISPFLGPNCRFYPSCSSYALESLKEYPTHTAIKKIIIRVSKCHPWNAGGYDPVKKVCRHE